jgi:hypothetical protein
MKNANENPSEHLALRYYVQQFFPQVKWDERLENTPEGPVNAELLIPELSAVLFLDLESCHQEKPQEDERINRVWNGLGYSVIRLRPQNLPPLAPFAGCCITAENPAQSIREAVHALASRTQVEALRRNLLEFQLNEAQLQADAGSILALRYPQPVSAGTADWPEMRWWDAEANGSLDPHHLPEDASASVWFCCPEGQKLHLPVKELRSRFVQAKGNAYDKAMHDACPFYPCGRSCGRASGALDTLLEEVLAQEEDPDAAGLQWLRYHLAADRLAFAKMAACAQPEDGERMQKLRRLMIEERGSLRLLLGGSELCVKDAADLDQIRAFNRQLPDVLVRFSLKPFDGSEAGRRLVLDYLAACEETLPHPCFDYFYDFFMRVRETEAENISQELWDMLDSRLAVHADGSLQLEALRQRAAWRKEEAAAVRKNAGA